MGYSNISAGVTPAQKLEVKEYIDLIKLILVFLVNLTKKERSSLRKMGPKRKGYVNDVYKALIANPGILPSSFDLNEFTKDVTLSSDLQDIANWLATLAEGIDDTLMAVGNEMMKQSDTGYQYLKTAAEGNETLTGTVDDISRHFERSSSEEEQGSDLIDEDEENEAEGGEEETEV